MRVYIDDLIEGCILSADVQGKLNRPILPKKTVLSAKLIEVLRAFLIKEVEVEKTLVNGVPFLPKVLIKENRSIAWADEKMDELNFIDLFLRVKKDFRKEFVSWQSGMTIDISKVRTIVKPLVELVEKLPAEIFHLHHYSTKQEYLYDHPLAVGMISAYLAKKLGHSKGDLMQIALAGCLSDCGMAKISPGLLNKNSTLTVEEFEEVKKHSTYSYQMIRNSPLLKDGTKLAILQHHERLDGSGYPFGEKAERIHPYAKIMALADTFHAMTSERVYKPRLSPFKIIEMIHEDLFGEFDMAALNALSSAVMTFSIGSKVRLSDGQEAEIVFMEDKSPTRPMVKLEQQNEIIALVKNRHLYIEEVIS